jgi:hypothetical protein
MFYMQSPISQLIVSLYSAPVSPYFPFSDRHSRHPLIDKNLAFQLAIVLKETLK